MPEIELSPRETGRALVAQYRESHHAVARMIAAGMSDSMIRRRTGYTHRRLTLMKQDPAFCQLIEDYKEEVFDKINHDTDTFAELSIGNMIAAERHITDRIAEYDERGELLPLNDSLKIVSDRADRFGYSKRVTQTNINVDIAVALDRAIDRSKAVKQIEHRAEEASPQPLLASPDVLVGEAQPSPPRLCQSPPPPLPRRKLIRRV